MKKKNTRELPFDPSKEVNTNYWNRMTLSELWDQEILLHRRLDYTKMLKQDGMARGIEEGLQILHKLIDTKTEEEERDQRSPLL